MNDDLKAIAMENAADRARILTHMYRVSGGRYGADQVVPGVAAALGFEELRMFHHFRYLKEEGLVGGAGFGSMYLEHAGVVEVDSMINRPDRPTEHFPANFITSINVAQGGTIGAVMTGSPGGIQTTTITTGSTDSLAAVLEGLRAAANDPAVPEADRRVIDSTATLVETIGDNPSLVAGLLERAKATLETFGAVPAAVTAAQAIGAYLGG